MKLVHTIKIAINQKYLKFHLFYDILLLNTSVYRKYGIYYRR